MTNQLTDTNALPIEPLVIDRDSSTPLYQQLLRQLKSKINAGQFAADVPFPTEQHLAEQLKLSPQTVRQALLGLAQQGYLVRRRGRGSFIRQPQIDHHPDQVTSSKTFRVGVVMPWGEHTFFASMLNDVENVLHGEGYRTMLVNNRDESDTELDRLREMIKNGVDGIIWMCPANGAHPEVLRMIRAMLPNVVGVDRLDPAIAEEMSLVNADNAGGMAALVDKLYHSGRKRIALVRTAATISSVEGRMAGYYRALRRLGVDVPDHWVYRVSMPSYSLEDAGNCGRQLLEQILASGEKYDAICCCTDYLAMGVVAGLQSRGIRVPDDIAVTGFDDSAGAVAIRPKLTSVHMNLGTIAAEAANLLLRQMKQHEENQIVSRVHINVPVEIMMRESASW